MAVRVVVIAVASFCCTMLVLVMLAVTEWLVEAVLWLLLDPDLPVQRGLKALTSGDSAMILESQPKATV